jgi:adenine/guanine/hypoxanthine permease
VTDLVVALLFLLTLFRAPLATAIPGFVTTPALVFVACLMAQALRGSDWDEATDYAPAVVTALAMPLTLSIIAGIGLGFATHAALNTIAGRGREVSGPVWLIAALCVVKFALP